ncbi:hypothetical protein [Rothia nasimurium]|uniref:hypothetical protein n=1 Tax=Rothia nasimurium TaxID=85336 RepID=UPI003B9E8476
MTNNRPQSSLKAPTSVLIVAFIGALQMIYLVVVAIWGTIRADELGPATVLASFYFILAGALGLGLFALYQGKRFGQPLVLVWQLFAVIIGVQTALGGFYLMGISSTVLAGCAVLLLFSKDTMGYLGAGSLERPERR